jgi:hypothetical protein
MVLPASAFPFIIIVSDPLVRSPADQPNTPEGNCP